MGSVPNEFATMAAGNVPAADLDANFTALAGLSGTLTSGHLVSYDSSNNLQDSGTAIYGGAALQTASANPASTTSTSAVMMGLGATCTLTPALSTRILLSFTGTLSNGTTGDGALTQIRYGTGTAPTHGAAATGTAVGSALEFVASASANTGPFSSTVILTGLTAGTAYWFDLALNAAAGGTASVGSVACAALEL